MNILAQHGFGDGTKIEAGLGHGLIQGAIISPRDIKLSSLKAKIESWKTVQPDCHILFDPQFYASLIAQEPGARLGNLSAEYSAYFAPKQYKDIRREKKIAVEIQSVIEFQQNELGLSEFILPGIMIQDGLLSESASIAKLFLEVGDEFTQSKNIHQHSWHTLVLGKSCFRNIRYLEDLVDEITGYGLEVQGFYLLAETTRSSESNPWFDADVLLGQMYLTYALTQAGYKVINGYSMLPATYLAAVGSDTTSSGWFDTLRYFSLDRYREQSGGGKRPNRRYFSKALWSRLDMASISAYLDRYGWILNGYDDDAKFKEGEANDTDEVLQHWHAVQLACNEVVSKSSIEERIQFLMAELTVAEQYRSRLLTLSMPHFQEQVAQCRSALHRFAELAEISLG